MIPEDYYEYPLEEQIEMINENEGRFRRSGISKKALHYLSAEAQRVGILNPELGEALRLVVVLVVVEFLQDQKDKQ